MRKGLIFPLLGVLFVMVVGCMTAPAATNLPPAPDVTTASDDGSSPDTGASAGSIAELEDLFYTSQDEAGLAAVAQYLAEHPDDADGFAWRAAFELRSLNADLGTAEANIQAALEINPDSALAHTVNGWLAGGYNEDYDTEDSELEQALSLDPDLPLALSRRGNNRRLEGDVEAALADLNRAVELRPDFVVGLLNRGWAHRDNGDLDAMLADVNAALEINDTYATSYDARAVYYQDMGDWETALADNNRAVKLAPDDPYVIAGRAWTYEWLYDYQAAVDDYLRARGLDSSFTNYSNLARLYYKLGDYDSMLAESEAWIADFPDNSFAYSNYAFLIAQIDGDLDLAMQHVETALSLDPESNDALISKAMILYKQGNIGEAQAILQSVYDSGDAYATYGLGLIMQDAGDTAAAIAYYQEFLDNFPNASVNEEVHQRLADLGG